MNARNLSFALFLIGLFIISGNTVLNDIRGAAGCAPYGWEGSINRELKLIWIDGRFVLLFVLVSFFAASRKPIATVNLVFSALLLLLACKAFYDSFSASYLPCDQKGDESSLFYFSTFFFGAGLWFFMWISVSFFTTIPRSEVDDKNAASRFGESGRR